MVQRKITRCKAIITTAAVGTSTVLGCVIPTSHLPLIEQYKKIPKKKMPKFIVGKTTYVEAIRRLRELNVSNLCATIGNIPGENVGTYRMLSGDNLNEIYVFRNMLFVRAVGMHAFPGGDIFEPTAVNLNLAVVKVINKSAVMVCGPRLADEQGNIGIIVVLNDESNTYTTVSHTEFDLWYAGVNMPYVSGSDLDMGTYFTARDKHGTPWHYAYRLKYKKERVEVVEKILTQRLLSCSECNQWFHYPERWLKRRMKAHLLE